MVWVRVETEVMVVGVTVDVVVLDKRVCLSFSFLFDKIISGNT